MSRLDVLFARFAVPIQLVIPFKTPVPKLHTQRHIASIRRRDGHTIDGIPGDCLRAAAATALGVDVGELRHYAMFLSWFNAMRLDARRHGLDWFLTVDGQLPVAEASLSLASGPSPRGSFWHVVVVDHANEMVHDPHPSRAGLVDHRDLFVLTLPYFPPPTFYELEAAR